MGNSSLSKNRSHSGNKSSTFYNHSSISNHNINEISPSGGGVSGGLGGVGTLIYNANNGADTNTVGQASGNCSSTEVAHHTSSKSASSHSFAKSKSNSLLARTSKVTIPYERWIKCDCKKWGHFKDFDFYNLTAVNPANNTVAMATVAAPTANSTANNSTSGNNIIIAIDKHANNSSPNTGNAGQTSKLTNNSLTLASCDFPANIVAATGPATSGASTSLSVSNSYFISANLNHYLTSNANPANNQTILSFENKNTNCNLQNTQTNTNLTMSGNSSSSSSNYGPLHYINGSFFKPIERLGDSQFILSQWPLNDIIVTVPCNIERYKANDKAAKDTAARLNRVIGVCEQFVVFQIWKGTFAGLELQKWVSIVVIFNRFG